MLVKAPAEVILAIFRHPRVWNAMAEDGQPPEYAIKPYTIGFALDDQAVILFRQMSWGGTFEAHIAAVRGGPRLLAWGRECLHAMRAAGAKKFIGYVGEWNIACLQYARKLGFQEEGRVQNALLRDGRRQALIILGST